MVSNASQFGSDALILAGENSEIRQMILDRKSS